MDELWHCRVGRGGYEVSARPGRLPSLPWQLRGGTAIRCLVAAAVIAVLVTFITVQAGRSTAYSIRTSTLGAALGTGLELWLSWIKRRLLAPRPPEGVSRWRVRQLTTAGQVPTDPAERAALARSLRGSQGLRARVLRTCSWILLVLFFLVSVVSFATWSMTGWVVVACVAYPAGLVLTWVEDRKASVTRGYLLTQLD